MRICTVDLETYWSQTHNLRKIISPVYSTHPDTEIISCAFKFDDGPTEVIFGEAEIIEYASQIDWSDCWVVGHNLSEFDAIILSWRMHVKPKLWGCTLAMARPIHSKSMRLSLASLVDHYGIGVKNQAVLFKTQGRHLKDFTSEEVEDMRKYNADDVNQTYELLKRLIPQTRRDEIKLIDMTIRMLVEPKLECDVDLLNDTYNDETERKEKVLSDLGDILINDPATRVALKITGDFDPENLDDVKKNLMSASKFKKLLEGLGVEVPMKESPTTGKPIPALAKSDDQFISLQEHENPLVARAAEARLDAKSTLLQTRILKFLDSVNANPDKRFPVTLRYCGADTTGRWSGFAYNPQNLPRVNPYKPQPSDALRKCLRAPKGHKVVVADLSGIELRVNHILWKVPSSMAMFKADPEKADLYKDFASKLYKVNYDDVTKEQRQVGKVAHLGLGFGSGHITFQKVAKSMGGVEITEDESRDIVDAWRSTYSEIKQGWYACNDSLECIMQKATGAAVDPWGLVTPTPEGLKTPKGVIRYPNLRKEWSDDDGRWETLYGNRNARIYGGKMNENIVQHLARQVVADNALDVQKLTGYNPVLTVHDELVYVAPDDEAEQLLSNVQAIMRTPPTWWPELVTWSEGDIAQTYGDAK